MSRVFALLFALSLALPAQAEGFITRLLNKPVPGGVAVIELGNGPSAPQARYQGKPTLVVREDGERWIAIVGIPLSAKAGPSSWRSMAAAPASRLATATIARSTSP